nr:DNA-3-methyladenine glycosylase 2 family protein [Chitinophagales bacterium]
SLIQNSDGELTASVLSGSDDIQSRNFIKKYVASWFDLETDIKPFYRMAKKDELLRPLVKKYFGYRMVGICNLFESLCWAIIGQQINLNFAYMLKQRFIMHFGERLLWRDKTYYLFPKIERIAALETSSLTALQFSRQKANYIIEVARTFESGKISQQQIAALSFEDAKEMLLSLKGIGNWTANYVLMKTFHHPNAFPLEDAGLQQAIKRNLNITEKPGLQMIKDIFSKYEGWEAYATLYLWRSLSD